MLFHAKVNIYFVYLSVNDCIYLYVINELKDNEKFS